MMEKIEIKERLKIQLDILDAVHEFCIYYKINYSLGYGTLLGAVRHGGYIPWDDDIDIVMLRKDYERFIQSFSTPIYSVASSSTIKNWFLPFAKVYDNRTIIIDRKAHTIPIGINIDVFPIDDAMDSVHEFKKQRRRIRNLTRCNNIKLFKINKYSKWSNNALAIIAKSALIIFPKHYFAKRLILESQKYNEKGYTKALYWASVGKTFYLDKIIYENISEIQFENHTYKSIKDYDTYLANIYGDYMIPPPIDKRISYHTSDAFWK